MAPRARSHNGYWACPKCNLPNPTPLVDRTPETITLVCSSCELRVDVFVPLEQEGPYGADGLMNDQIAAELEDTPWWDFVCPRCKTHNRRTPPPYRLGQPRDYDRIIPCQGCHKNIRVKGTN